MSPENHRDPFPSKDEKFPPDIILG